MEGPSGFESGHRLPADVPSAFVGLGASTSSSTSSLPKGSALNSTARAAPPMSYCDRNFKAAMPVGKEKRKRSSEDDAAFTGSARWGRPSFPSFSPVGRSKPSPHIRRHSDSDVAHESLSLRTRSESSHSTRHDSEKPSSLQSRRYWMSAPGSQGSFPFNNRHLQPRGDTELSNDKHALDAGSLARRNSTDFELQLPRHGEKSHSDQDSRGSNQTPLPIPPSPLQSEVIPAKDDHDLKTWTGTQLFPKFIRAAEVPGLGLRYFYDDGSSCKAVIDGEAVNSHLGWTKAGKPRKRLALACVTCRDRKIKCDPDFPRCVQCKNHGRICKLKDTVSEDNYETPTATPTETYNGTKPKSARQTRYPRPGGKPDAHLSPRIDLPSGYPRKRTKLDYHVSNASGGSSLAALRTLENAKSPHKVITTCDPETPRTSESLWNRAWQTDPCAIDPRLVGAVITKFFAHIDNTMILQLLPEGTIKSWVTSSMWRKSPEDLMLVYSMLAVGTALSGGPKHVAHQYVQVARDTHRVTTSICLQVAQGMILLAVYYISASMRREFHDSISTAAHICATLQLNLEFDKTREASATTFPLALSRSGYSEARRRTMWSLFMLERLNGWCLGRMTVVNAEDLYIRLPADLRTFESQLEGNAPMFDPSDFQIFRATDRPQEVASYLVQMVHFWAESQSSSYKLVHRPTHPTLESSRINNLLNAISQWRSALPKHLDSMASNLEDATMAGQLGSFITMHLLCNHAIIKLKRDSGAARQVSLESKQDAMEKCHHCATQILQLVENLHRLLRSRPMTLSGPPPMMAVVVDEAVDILNSSRPLAPFEGVVDLVRVMEPFVGTISNVSENLPSCSRTHSRSCGSHTQRW